MPKAAVIEPFVSRRLVLGAMTASATLLLSVALVVLLSTPALGLVQPVISHFDVQDTLGQGSAVFCVDPANPVFQGYVMQLGYSNKTQRYYFTAGQNLYATTTPIHLLDSTSPLTLLATWPGQILWYAPVWQYWLDGLFLINELYSPSDPNTDHIVYSHPLGCAQNGLVTYLVTNDTSRPGYFKAILQGTPHNLTSAYSYTGYIEPQALVWDRSWNVSWFFSSNSPLPAGQNTAPGTSIAWFDHLTSQWVELIDVQIYGNNPIFNDAVVVKQRQTIYWTNSTQVFFTPLSNQPFSFTGFQLSLWQSFQAPGAVALSLQYVDFKDTLLVGCTFGLIFELDLNTLTVTKTFLFVPTDLGGLIQASSVQVYSLIQDPVHPDVVFVSAITAQHVLQGSLLVSSTGILQEWYAYIQWQGNNNPSMPMYPGGSTLIVDGNPFVYLSGAQENAWPVLANYFTVSLALEDHGTWNYSGNVDSLYNGIAGSCIFAYQTHNCSIHTSCTDCQLDTNYCGWCPVSQTCTDSASLCRSTQDVWSQNYVCPVSTFSYPMTLPSTGNVNVTLGSTIFDATNNLTCNFTQGSSVVGVTASTYLSSTTVSCPVPASLPFSGNSTSVDIKLASGLETWGTPYSLTYANCSAYSSCGSCVASGACGWCLSSDSCSHSSVCTDGSLSPQCPVISNFTIDSISSAGGEHLSFLATNILSYLGSTNYSYSLQFNSPSASASVTLVPIATNSSKRASSSSAAPSFNLTVTVPSISGTAYTQAISLTLVRSNDNKVIATAIIEAYNCASYSPCYTCFNVAPRCTWCSATSTCSDISLSGSCSSQQSSCPFVSKIVPFTALVGTSETVTVDFVNVGSTSGLNCIITPESGSVTSQPVTVVNSTAVSCGIPSSLAVGFYSVALGTSTPTTNPATFEVYDCTRSPCDQCFGNGRTGCQWCDDFSANLGCTLATDSCAAPITATSGTCPFISSTNPSPILANTMSSVNLAGHFNPALYPNGTCTFYTPAGAQNGSITYASTTTVSCSAVSFGGPSQGQVSVLYQDLTYTENVSITIYECSSQTDCISCQRVSICNWTPAGCWLAADTSQPAVTQCPTLSYLYPTTGLAVGGDSVTVFGGPFSPTATYYCNFGGQLTPAAAYTTTSVSCASPSTTGLQSMAVDLTIMTSPPTVQYAPTVLTYTYVNCPLVSTTICSDACVAAPTTDGVIFEGCGFCTSSGVCTTEDRCTRLWVPNCFSTLDLTPNFAPVGVSENVSITVNLAPQLPVGLSVRATDFTCDWTASQTAATLTGWTNTGPGSNSSSGSATITCSTPAPLNSPGFYPFSINYFGTPFTGTYIFPYRDCTPQDTCTSCINAGCNWCLDSQSCTANDCPLGNLTTTACPSVTSLLPSSGATNGGDLVTITGKMFLDTPNLQVLWGTTAITPTFVSNTTLTFNTPSGASGDVVTVTLIDQGRLYSSTNATFTYTLGHISVVGLAVGLSLGLLVLVVVAILIIIFVYRRARKGALIFSISEPDYALVAFGSNNSLAYRMPPDNFALLEQVLGRNGFSLQVSIASNSPPTEEDLVAKSMLYVAQSQSNSVGVINAMVRGEIRRCLEENTIFRNNSVASKTFKFYSRVVGIPYLWKCMARVIYELEVLGNRSNKQKERDSEQGTSLLRMTMEVDMDRIGDDSNLNEIDSEVNALQLKLTCQKLYGVLVKNGVADIPAEFRKIFVEIDQEIMKKFNSDMAVYKAIGGFFFLRFVCPAITAPHYYGLLENPPNEVTQRQLVLISKVIQSLANMQMPGRKETYMESMSDFIEKNMGSVVKFYQDMREASRVHIGSDAEMEVPENVRLNSLASLWEFLLTHQQKIQTDIDTNTPEQFRSGLQEDWKQLLQAYPTKPKKVGSVSEGAASSKGSSAKKKKKDRSTKDM